MTALRYTLLYITVFAAALFTSCRNDDIIFIPEEVPVGRPEFNTVTGFYLLNEGNMGSNKSTLDYYDYSTGVYTRNIYGSANPDVPKEMGDVGNDIAIYGSRMYAVINCSNKVEVMDAATARRMGQIDIPNCRFIRFWEGYAYVTSYAGPVVIDPEYRQKGFVAKVDTATMQVVDRCIVGFQPDGLDIADGKIYVANSGGYMVPNYENTVTVIDLSTFKVLETVQVAINLEYCIADRYGNLWVSSRGDYYDIPPRLYCYDTRKRRMEKVLDVNVGNYWLDGDSLYVIAVDNRETGAEMPDSYQIVNIATREVASECFITDGTEARIHKPYAVAVNPVTKEIFVADARNYVNPGYLYCFGRDGVLKWSVRTGDIPAHIVFTGQSLNEY